MLFDSNAANESDYLAHKHFYSEARFELLLRAYREGATSSCAPRAYARIALRDMANACLGIGNDHISKMLYDLYYITLLEVESAFAKGHQDGGDAQAEQTFLSEIRQHIIGASSS